MDTLHFEAVDFFRAREAKDLYQNPYPFHEYLRSHGPVWREPRRGVVMVTGYEEAMAVYNDYATFSSCNTVAGPFTPLPGLEAGAGGPRLGRDINEIIEEHRDTLPFSDQLPSFDPPKHTAHRGLLMRLITPKRLKENEEFMWRIADHQIDEFHGRASCEFINDYAGPFTLLVIADLLGVPEEDHETFRRELQVERRPTQRGDGGKMAHKPLEFLYDRFTAYIEDRRRNPRDDVMTSLATATFPDNSLPEVDDVMRIAGNLFAAGQETTARLLGTMLRIIGERPDLQERLRRERDVIPRFVEECVRLESPLQGQFRLARRHASVGGVDIAPGTSVYVMPGAANRDPRQFDHPNELRLDRPNWRQHLGFGFGIHTCAGAPLARAEARVSTERLLDRLADIRISEVHHGSPEARRYDYTPLYLMRGLENLHLEFTPGD